jgi:uncharacterized tellurite resistance protein B-like protein
MFRIDTKTDDPRMAGALGECFEGIFCVGMAAEVEQAPFLRLLSDMLLQAAALAEAVRAATPTEPTHGTPHVSQ